ncbi:MAG: proline--tRNA ligase [Bacteriovoracaceae bacterium]
MKLSQGYWQTIKETPSDAEIPSHQLMIRAGLINKTGAGLYTYMPMGLRSIRKVEKIVREELDKIGCFEITMGVVTPGELWKETGRWDVMGQLMLRFQDRQGRDLCISPTNEETVTDLFRKTVKSYKQLPVTLYQINTKFRDEIRPRFGLMRGREFTMKDAYSFHENKDCLDKTYNEIYQAYCNIFSRLGLEYIAVEADGGAMAGGQAKTHEFQVVAEAGEDQLIYCAESQYAANIEKSEAKRSINNMTAASELKMVATPSKSTIEDVCQFLGKPQEESLKALVYVALKEQKEEVLLAFVHGDDQLNEIKLQNFLKAEHLAPATEKHLAEFHLTKGFIGPKNLKSKIRVILDQSINDKASYVAGANEVDQHFQGLVVSRDLAPGSFEIADIRLSKTGDLCPKSGKPVVLKKGIEVGHVFQLGDKYTKAMNVTILNKEGKGVTPIMGCYGIGTTRTVAAAIEQHYDKDGIIWPVALAPYHVYFGVIGKAEETMLLASDIYNELNKSGVETVLDDRGQGPGVMFKDADLIGLPLRVVLGERDYKEAGLLEIRVRRTGESFKVTRQDLIKKCQELLGILK